MLDILPDANGLANDFVSDDTGVWSLAPTASKDVYISATHAAVCDADVDIVICEWFWLVFLPLHVPDGILVESAPSFEFTIGRHV